MKKRAAVLLFLAPSIFALAQTASKPVELEHFDLSTLDTAADPCVDFSQYVCSRRLASNPIPPDQVVWGPIGELISWNTQVLHGILEQYEKADPARTPNQQKIGDYYASCVNQASSNANDEKAIEPLLGRIAGMQSTRDIPGVLAAIHRSIERAWESGENQANSTLLGYGPQADYNDVSRMVAGVDQGGLGLPTRDFYLKQDAQSKAILGRYTAFVQSLFQLSGEPEDAAKRDADTVVRIETELAKAQMDNISRRDPAKVNNRYTLQQLKALTPHFDWDQYLKALDAPSVPLYEVASPDFFRAVDQMLVSDSLDDWKTYMRGHLLESSSGMLGNSWRDARFAFVRLLTGQKEQEPAWRRCSESVDGHIGDALGQEYVAEVFPPSSKERVLEIVHGIEAAMGRDIDEATWMQPATKREAHLKLSAMVEKIGYPDKWIDYSTLSIGRESFPGNVERANEFELKRQLSFIGKPLDRTLWGMTPPTVNAYEDPQANTINFPAGMLQPVWFDSKLDDVVNYGSEGSVMGHELTHDFDDEGRKFDAKGNLRDWWTAQDAKAYDQRGECIAKEYTGPVPGVPGVQQNGKLTQGEDTADNGGIYLALSALAQDLKRQGKSLEDKDAQGFTNLQRFFIAYATDSCDQFRPELQRTLVLMDVHSMPVLRINNVVGNMPEFQQAFHCKAGQPMVHAPRCRVW